MLLRRVVVRIFSVGLMGLGAGVDSAQDPSTGSGQVFPNKPIRIVTAAAGGGSDFAARTLAQGISGPLGQPVIVENRGSGLVQYEFLAKAPPDGYGLLVTGMSFWVAPLLQKIPYDVLKDFSPVSLLVREVFVVAVHPSVPAKSISELIALAKARPGELNYSSGVTATPTHLASELFKSMAGVNIVRVAYKGTSPAITALMSGEVQMTIVDALLVMPHVKTGKLRALAITNAQPSALVPGLPTIAASGLPGFEAAGVTVLFAPGNTPAPILNRLSQEVVRALNQPDVKERFLNVGAEVVANSPEQFTALIKTDIAKWSKIIKDSGIRAD